MNTEIEMLMNKSRKDPAWFIETVFGQYPCRRDSAICHALTRDRVVVVPKIHEIVELSVRLAFYFLYSFRGAQVLVVSPTKAGTSNWFEVLKEAYWSSSYDFGGSLLEDRFILSSDSFILGLEPTVDQLDQSLGFTLSNTLVIFTDADRIPHEVQKILVQSLSLESGKLLSLGRFDPRGLNEKG
jgi:hypothetical protein